MCLLIAQFCSDAETGNPYFILGENRDAPLRSMHHKNHVIKGIEAFPDVGMEQTWIGVSNTAVAALLNNYPEEHPQSKTGSRGIIVPRLLRMSEPSLGMLEEPNMDLENINPFRVLLYSIKTQTLVMQVWDGEQLSKKQTFSEGRVILASSSYGEEIRMAREKKAIDLLEGVGNVTREGLQVFFSTTGEDGYPTSDSPCMEAKKSQSVASQVITVQESIVHITGYAGPPNIPEEQHAHMDEIIRV